MKIENDVKGGSLNRTEIDTKGQPWEPSRVTTKPGPDGRFSGPRPAETIAPSKARVGRNPSEKIEEGSAHRR